MLQQVAAFCSVLQCVVMRYNVLQWVVVGVGKSSSANSAVSFLAKVCCSVLQCVAVCCSVLQCVAVWCRVVQYVTARVRVQTAQCL